MRPPTKNFLQNILLPDPVTGCMYWRRYVNRGGYGVTGYHRGTKLAHVAMWEMYNGPKPDGMVLDHICHNLSDCTEIDQWCLHRRCCNPEHLELKTQQANSDASPNSWQNRGHCRYGHPFTPENTVTSHTDRPRRCRTCERERQQRRAASAAYREYQRRWRARRKGRGSAPQ